MARRGGRRSKRGAAGGRCSSCDRRRTRKASATAERRRGSIPVKACGCGCTCLSSCRRCSASSSSRVRKSGVSASPFRWVHSPAGLRFAPRPVFRRGSRPTDAGRPPPRARPAGAGGPLPSRRWRAKGAPRRSRTAHRRRGEGGGERWEGKGGGKSKPARGSVRLPRSFALPAPDTSDHSRPALPSRDNWGGPGRQTVWTSPAGRGARAQAGSPRARGVTSPLVHKRRTP